MTVDLKELQEQRGQLATRIRELADTQDQWTPEDRQAWDDVNADYDGVMEQIDAHELARQVEERRAQLQADNEQTRLPVRGTGRSNYGTPQPGISQELRAQALQAWVLCANELPVSDRLAAAADAVGVNMRASYIDLNISMRSPMSGFEMFSVQRGQRNWGHYEAALATRAKHEQRWDTGTPGGAAELVPELFQYELERAMMAYGGFRGIARILPTAGGNPLRWPTVDDTANAAVIVDEGASFGAETPPPTGKVDFGAYKYSSLPVLVTAEMMEDSAFNVAALLGSLLGERLGRGQAVHLATGDGTTQPEGVTVGGTATVTAASGTTIDPDELIDVQTALDPAYAALSSVGWAMNNTTLGVVRKMKDLNGQYLWRPGLTLAEPDLLLGARYAVIQEMPDIGLSAKPIAYGAFEKFVIRSVSSVRLYRLEELYRANDQTGFVAFSRMDSKVIQATAIQLLQMAAS